ncbi:YciI family protein [Vibrio sp.]|uniref:GTP cyclohydrolase n=1 Tax=Vibrio viridaestus TaxID=2487322 RepID=A0A3N9TKE5_9VIBR|nr:YciI family protein [Vibrio viridaestus]MDC0609711.1 YciI family protein [Vibrio sp.]RQW64581.1 GTP cyclohydrolase [Vibrio viridaestus]
MFIISLHYICEIDDIEKHLPNHISFLDKYYSQGIFLASGRKEPRTGGVILAVAENRSQIEVILEEDPFHQHCLAEYTITEFIPTKACSELSFLLQ